MPGMHCSGLNDVFDRRVCRIVCITSTRVGELVSQALRGSAVDAGAVSAVTTGPALEGKGRGAFSRSDPVIHVGPCCHHPSINVPLPALPAPDLAAYAPCFLFFLIRPHTLLHTLAYTLYPCSSRRPCALRFHPNRNQHTPNSRPQEPAPAPSLNTLFIGTSTPHRPGTGSLDHDLDRPPGAMTRPIASGSSSPLTSHSSSSHSSSLSRGPAARLAARRQQLGDHVGTVAALQRDLSVDVDDLRSVGGWDPVTAHGVEAWLEDRGMIFRALRVSRASHRISPFARFCVRGASEKKYRLNRAGPVHMIAIHNLNLLASAWTAPACTAAQPAQPAWA